jgi:transcriptional regulator GlxA family with amidase domain
MSTKSSTPVAWVRKWSAPTTTDARVRRVEFLLQLNLERELRVLEVASLTGLSVSALSRLFKRRTGTTPARYIKSARMEKAKELLETSYLRVKEIAGRVGVADMSHFVRDFRTAVRPEPSPLPALVLGGSGFGRATPKSANK